MTQRHHPGLPIPGPIKVDRQPVPVDLTQNMDASAWASEFMRLFRERGAEWVDEGLMLGWFANAIMAGYDRASNRVTDFGAACPVCASPVVVRLPDGWDDGRAIPIVGCGNPWHYATRSLGDPT